MNRLTAGEGAAGKPGPTVPAGSRSVLRDGTGLEKTVALCGAVLVLVLTALAVLEPAAVLLAGGALLLYAALLVALRRRVQQRHRQDQLTVAEAERGLRELERWLSGPRA